MTRLARDRRGVSAVETALAFPVFALFLYALVDLGLMAWSRVSLQFAVEEAARCYSIKSPSCLTVRDTQRYAVGATYGFNATTENFSVGTEGCGVRVRGFYRYAMMSHIGTSLTTLLSADTCMPM
ncbi:TadE/TadG family type IV pilus assembly protein [Prosthecomicrobium sp. N25]|uniref:TadE/TadG family type IV pilus assembly protein n=1 Tax=Prosthecomicrobium sp. N25 TaxID=3129254 RepID=UPI0030770F41